MTETPTSMRLKQVAVEFNVAISTIVDYLDSKGIEVEGKPTSKISGEAYEILLEKFQPDKLDKLRSDKLKLTPLIHKEEKADAPKAEEKPAPKPAEPVKPIEPVKPVPVAEKPAPAPKPEEKPAPKAEEKPAKEEDDAQKFKVVGKIDLNKLDKKKGKSEKPAEEAKEAPKKEAAAPVAEKKEESVKEEKPKVEAKAEEKKEEQVAAKAEVKEEKPVEPPKKEAKKEDDKPGLTIVGKIDLSQFNKAKKKPVASTDDLSTMKKKRRKRKRIGDAPAGPGTDNAGQGGNRPPRQGGPPQRSSGPPPGRGRNEPKVVDDKAIQEEVKKTLTRLQQKAGFSETKSKLKKKKREERRQKQVESENVEQSNKLRVTEFITANELASLMNVSVAQVITACMSLGLMVSINQRLDAETIAIVADEFGYEVEFHDAEMDEPTLEDEDDEDEMIDRAPIVTIMGHVDHGKTSLLDYVRSSNVVAGEAGGITQHIGAYEVTLEDARKITFLDTPGHEAFTAMRARGAKLTDIAIIVIAADDSVMPQTKEAISHAQAAGVPIVFAFNKIDKDGANPNRLKEQLADMNILVEDWGGKFQSQEISAKKGLNVRDLLDKVLLEAEMLELKADPTKRATGTIVEAELDKGKGIVVTLLVQKGTLRVGDPILAGANFGRVKAMFNERGGRVSSAGPSTPVQILGFDGAPTAGDKFYVTENEHAAKEIANKRKQLIREQGIRTRKHITLDEIGRRLAIGNFQELNLVIKGDFDGSVEALSDSLEKLSTQEIQINVIHKGVGQITESDVLLATASDAIIVGFQVRPSMSARKLAEQEQIDIRLYSVIYNAIEEIKLAMEGMLEPTQEERIVGNAEIRDTFKVTKVGTVAGCYVLDGKINRNHKIRIIRDGVVVYSGELASLKRFKDDVKEVASGYECGLNIHNFNDIKVGDIVEAYEQISVERKL